MSFIKALVVNLAISAVWYASEYQQFGELQWDRQCDNIVWYVYLCVLWYLFHKKDERRKDNDEMRCNLPRIRP